MIFKLEGGMFVPGTENLSTWYLVFISMSFVSLIYSYTWDIVMDWGLLRSSEPGTYGLRPVIHFSRAFYYYAMVADFVLRCTFLIPAFINVKGYPWLTTIGYGTLIAILELYRRWFWSLLRIENEQVHNLEKYRNVHDIPEVNDHVEDRKLEEAQYTTMIKNVLHAFDPKKF